jgi:hypothetical protein
MCVQLVAIEGPGVSPVKIGLMGVAHLFISAPYINRVFLLGMAYWLFLLFQHLL